MVIDGVILIVSSVEGVQAHTELIWEALKKRGIPVIEGGRFIITGMFPVATSMELGLKNVATKTFFIDNKIIDDSKIDYSLFILVGEK